MPFKKSKKRKHEFVCTDTVFGCLLSVTGLHSTSLFSKCVFKNREVLWNILLLEVNVHSKEITREGSEAFAWLDQSHYISSLYCPMGNQPMMKRVLFTVLQLIYRAACQGLWIHTRPINTGRNSTQHSITIHRIQDPPLFLLLHGFTGPAVNWVSLPPSVSISWETSIKPQPQFSLCTGYTGHWSHATIECCLERPRLWILWNGMIMELLCKNNKCIWSACNEFQGGGGENISGSWYTYR